MIECLEASADAQVLMVTWDNGQQSVLPARLLRQEARDADSLRERIENGAVTVAPGVRITGLFEVGGYGVNIHFSDGHDRAIYPYTYIRDLCADNGSDVPASNDN
ncbi:MAG: gamma-butyrobetaine hydroxylase-like domain-containing protein [Pseudomonadota bacterium]